MEQAFPLKVSLGHVETVKFPQNGRQTGRAAGVIKRLHRSVVAQRLHERIVFAADEMGKQKAARAEVCRGEKSVLSTRQPQAKDYFRKYQSTFSISTPSKGISSKLRTNIRPPS